MTPEILRGKIFFFSPKTPLLRFQILSQMSLFWVIFKQQRGDKAPPTAAKQRRPRRERVSK